MDIEIPHVGSEGGLATAVVGLLAAAALTACAWAAARLIARLRAGQPPVEWRPHEPVAWNGGDVALVALVYIACQILAASLMPPPPTVQTQLTANVLGMLAGTALSIALLRGRAGSPAALGIDLARPAADIRLAVEWLALIVPPLLVVAAVVDRIVPYRHPIIDYLASHRGPAAVLMVIASAVVAAPIAEEFLFRRVLQGWLEKRLAGHADDNGLTRAAALAITISAAVFAAAHVGQGLGWVPLLFFGLVTGLLARQTGSIVPGIVLHALFNAVSVVLVLAQTA